MKRRRKYWIKKRTLPRRTGTIERDGKTRFKKRFEKGAIAFEKDEVRFELDEFARPIAVHVKARIDTNKLIEDFMLLANRRVAEFMSKKTRTSSRHSSIASTISPDADKVKELVHF